jgi:fructokinase
MSDSPPRTAVCAGYMPLDIIDGGDRVWRRAGGTAGNVAAILAFLGWKSSLAGRVGDDEAGSELLGDLHEAGVDSGLLQREAGAATNRLVHRIGVAHNRYLFTCPNCNQRLPRSRPLTLSQVEKIVSTISSADVYFFDRANAATVELAERYAASGALVVFEPSMPANAGLLQRALAAAAIVKSSDEHGPLPDQVCAPPPSGQLRVVTEGAAGVRFRLGRGRWKRLAAYSVPAVLDAAGAGDWMTAAIIDALGHRGRGIDNRAAIEALKVGQSLAALNCRLPGARALAEGRTLAEVLHLARSFGLAVRLRDHGEHMTMPAEPADAAPQPRTCGWCLLPAASGQSAVALG